MGVFTTKLEAGEITYSVKRNFLKYWWVRSKPYIKIEHTVQIDCSQMLDGNFAKYIAGHWAQYRESSSNTTLG
jgi:hypothetical protein